MATPGKENMTPERAFDLRDWIVSIAIIGFIRVLGLLPYRWRGLVWGWVLSRVAGPLIGYRTRITDNLDLIFPEMSAQEKERLARAVPFHIGRTLSELFSPEELIATAARTPMSGDGVAALDEAHRTGRPVIVVSGHFGNYDVVRSALIQRGHAVGGLYREMNYRGFNDYYVSRISKVGTPLFPRGRRGMANMIKFLKAGNVLALLIDQHMGAGAPLKFFDHTASTALSAADMALRYDALLIPAYAIRRPDGINFDVIAEAPIPHTTPEEMTQRLNDSLEARVRENMEQWLWIHRRWKEK